MTDIQHFLYDITRNSLEKVKAYHEAHKDEVDKAESALALAIGWNAMECFTFLKAQGYPITKNTIEEAQVSPNPIYLQLLKVINKESVY